MLTTIIYPSLWLTFLALVVWASLTGRQKHAWRILLLGAVMYGLGHGLRRLGGNFLELGVFWPFSLGSSIRGLGLMLVFSGLIGLAVKLRMAVFGRRPVPVAPPAAGGDTQPVIPPTPISNWRRVATHVGLLYTAVLLGWTICTFALGLGPANWPTNPEVVSLNPTDPALTRKLGINDQDWREIQQLAAGERGYIIKEVDLESPGVIWVELKNPADRNNDQGGPAEIYEKENGVWKPKPNFSGVWAVGRIDP